MLRVSLSLLFAVLGAVALADQSRIDLSINGNPIGTNLYEASADGDFKSVTDVDLAGKHFLSTLSGQMADGKIASFEMVSEIEGTKVDVSFKDGKYTQTVGDNVIVREVKGSFSALYANNHPQLATSFLPAMKPDVLGDQTVETLMVDSGTIKPLKVRFIAGKPFLKDGVGVPVRRLSVDLVVARLEYAFDKDGHLLGEHVPVQKMVAVLQGYAGLFSDPLDAYPELSQPTYKIKSETGIGIRMRDGVMLVHDMYRPDTSGRFPVILYRTPYGKEGAAMDAEFYARRGYIYISQDCRGRDASNGDWDPFLHEREDGKDTIDWIAKQPWCDGRVGMIGGSYMGYVQWAAAAEHPAALKCIVPQVSPPDAFTNLPYDNGIPMLYSGLWWANIISGKETHLERATMPLKDPDALTSLPLSTIDEKVLGYQVPFWRLWVSRDNASKWKGYDILKDVAKVTIPSLSISGWWDGDEIGTQLIWQLRRAAGVKRQWLIYGPWTHAFNTSSRIGDEDYGPDALIDLDSLYLRWFDTWLKSKSVGLDQVPRVRVFVTGENKWHNLKDWPDPEAGLGMTMYLSADGPANGIGGVGAFAQEPPEGQEPDRYTYDPANVALPPIFKSADPLRDQTLQFKPYDREDDLLVYRSPAMDKAVTIGGPITLDLYFSTTAKDTDFFAVLFDEDEHGVRRYIDQAGKVRASFMKSLDAPELLSPGKIYRVAIKLWDTAHRFEKGHRLGLVITSQMFPAYARNLNTGEPIKDATRMIAASQTVYHDKDHPSALRLQILSF